MFFEAWTGQVIQREIALKADEDGRGLADPVSAYADVEPV